MTVYVMFLIGFSHNEKELSLLMEYRFTLNAYLYWAFVSTNLNLGQIWSDSLMSSYLEHL